MIVGERILEVSGNKAWNANISGLSINISLEDVAKAADGNLEITYAYNVNYETDVGTMKIKGVLIAKEERCLLKSVLDTWKSNKKLPDEYATHDTQRGELQRQRERHTGRPRSRPHSPAHTATHPAS